MSRCVYHSVLRSVTPPLEAQPERRATASSLNWHSIVLGFNWKVRTVLVLSDTQPYMLQNTHAVLHQGGAGDVQNPTCWTSGNSRFSFRTSRTVFPNLKLWTSNDCGSGRPEVHARLWTSNSLVVGGSGRPKCDVLDVQAPEILDVRH